MGTGELEAGALKLALRSLQAVRGGGSFQSGEEGLKAETRGESHGGEVVFPGQVRSRAVPTQRPSR